MKTILVTGGAGFIGSHTVVELVQAGYQVVIVDNLSNSKESALDGIRNITDQKPIFYNADYADTHTLKKIITDEGLKEESVPDAYKDDWNWQTKITPAS